MTEQIQTVNHSIDFDKIVSVITCFPFQLFNNLTEYNRIELIKLFCKVVSNVPECDDNTCKEIIKNVNEVYEKGQNMNDKSTNNSSSRPYITKISITVSRIPYQYYISMSEQDKIKLINILSDVIDTRLNYVSCSNDESFEFNCENDEILKMYELKHPELKCLHRLVEDIMFDCYSDLEHESMLFTNEKEWCQVIDEAWNKVCRYHFREINMVKKLINETFGSDEFLLYQLKPGYHYSYFKGIK